MTIELSKALQFPFEKDEYTSFLLSAYTRDSYTKCQVPDDILFLTEKYLQSVAHHRGSYQYKFSLNDLKSKKPKANEFITSDTFEVGGIEWQLAVGSYYVDTKIQVQLQDRTRYVNVEACAKLCFVETNEFFIYPFDLNGDSYPVEHSINLNEIQDMNDLTILIHIQILRVQNSDALIFDYKNWPSDPQTFTWHIDQTVIKKIISCHNKKIDEWGYRPGSRVYSPIFNNFWNVYVDCKSLSLHIQTCGFPQDRILARSHTEGGIEMTSTHAKTRVWGEIYIEQFDSTFPFDVACNFESSFGSSGCLVSSELFDQLGQLNINRYSIEFRDVHIETVKAKNFETSPERKYKQYSQNMRAIENARKYEIKNKRKRKYEEIEQTNVEKSNRNRKRIKLTQI